MKTFMLLIATTLLLGGCAHFTSSSEVVSITEVKEGIFRGLKDEDRDAISNLRKISHQPSQENLFYTESSTTENYSVHEYLRAYPSLRGKGETDYTVGGYDVLSVKVYDEGDLSREAVRVSGDGDISFPLIGRLKVEGLTTGQIEDLVARKLAEGHYLLDAQVTIMLERYESKKYSVLGAVKKPGAFPFKAKEHLLDAICDAEGVDFNTAGDEIMIIRTGIPPGSRSGNNPDEKRIAARAESIPNGSAENIGSTGDGEKAGQIGPAEEVSLDATLQSLAEMNVANLLYAPPEKIVIHVDLEKLLKGNDQISNLPLLEDDLVYIPEAELFYILGEVNSPGSYKITKKDMTLVESIGTAGGFTPISNRKKTRIIRVEDNVEKVITVNVDAITSAGRKIHDITIKPGDIIVVPESFF